MRRRWLLVFGLVLTAFGIVISAWQMAPDASPKVRLGDQVIELEVAKTLEERQKGLSGRYGLAHDAGMLFVFDDAGNHCFWMKDMRFSIDMIWLDAQKKVVTLKKSISPLTYPESFCPTRPAQYVIEVNAGLAEKTGLTEGATLNF